MSNRAVSRCLDQNTSLPSDKGSAWIWSVALLMGIQVGIIILQEHVGPAFFLPKRVCSGLYTRSPSQFSHAHCNAADDNSVTHVRLSPSNSTAGSGGTGTISWRLFYLHGCHPCRPVTSTKRGRREGAAIGAGEVGPSSGHEEELQSGPVPPSLCMLHRDCR